MKSEREIFIGALHRKDSIERVAYLDKLCFGDEPMRTRVVRLLQESDKLGDFLELPSMGDYKKSQVSEVSERPGDMIDQYQLLDEIGHGGMGKVFLAAQLTPIHRRVAIKIIKPGLDSAEVLSRFEAERQTLALMDHPNIARVLDGGTTKTGRPFFVMELVMGESITDYCDKNELNFRERLGLFVSVCRAIQHAHQKGIIHRDIKPSNVLIALVDGFPVPKVIDFGVAKAINQSLLAQTIFTRHGQIVGTLEYMSPEQADPTQTDVDTRSDIYSLGVLAYELLTGTTPLQRKSLLNVGFLELLRIIREVEPPRPSTRLTHSGAGPMAMSAKRKTDLAHLTRVARGELDWIVMKALDKDRGRRYETSSDLARDVERFLAGEPVEACPPSQFYRFKKLLLRNRTATIAAMMVSLTLLCGIVGTTWGMLRANQARREEEQQRFISDERKKRAEESEQAAIAQQQIAEAVQHFLEHDLLRQADAKHQATSILEQGGNYEIKYNPTIKELLDRAAEELAPEKINTKFPGHKLVQASILQTVGETYLGLGEYSEAIAFLKRAFTQLSDLFGSENPKSLNALRSLARAYREKGDLPETIALFERVRDSQIIALGPDDRETLATIYQLASAYQMASNLGKAVDAFKQVSEKQIQTLGAEHADTLITLNSLAWVNYVKDGDSKKALESLSRVIEAQARTLGANHPNTLETKSQFGVIYIDTGDMPRALELLQEVCDGYEREFGPGHLESLTVRHNLIVGYCSAKKWSEAVSMFEQLYELELEKLGAEHPLSLSTLSYLAGVHWLVGEKEKSLALSRQVVEVGVQFNFRNGFDNQRIKTLIARLEGLNRMEEAESWWRKWLTGLKRQLDPDVHLIALDLKGLGENLLQQQKWLESEDVLRECISLSDKLESSGRVRFIGIPLMQSIELSYTKVLLGSALSGQGRLDEAEQLMLTGYREMIADNLRVGNESTVIAKALERMIRFYEQSQRKDDAAVWQKELDSLH